MKIYCLELFFITCITFASSNVPKRFSDYEAHDTSEWSWISKDQLADAQTSQVNWPRNGNSGSVKGKGDQNPNRDGSWAPDNWASGGNRNDGTEMRWNTQPQGNNKGSAYPEEDQEGDLETILRGVPGMDFPNFVNVPDTDFDCSSMPSQGYYGDVDAGCQVFHICQPGNRKDSFLCPLGTIFNQKYFVCDWWFNVNCSDTPSYYELNNEVYKDPITVTEEVPVTTEKSMPWDSQDLDRKKPTKSWGNQPSSGKQNPNWKGTPSRRGSKSPGSVSTSREVSNTWSRSDVQKEVTLSWGAASSSPSETYVSSSANSNTITPTAKPIWYGIDGQPAKDQSNGMSKRVGLMQTPVPFGTRIRKTNGWTTTNPYESVTSPMQSGTYKTTTTSMGVRGFNNHKPSPTVKSGHVDDDITDSLKTKGGSTWNNDVDYDYSTTKSWLKGEDSPGNSINPAKVEIIWKQPTTEIIGPEISNNPTRIKGVWKEETSKRMDLETSIDPKRTNGVWKKQNRKGLDPETSINPTRINGVWEKQNMKPETSITPTTTKSTTWEQQQIMKRMDPETSIIPTEIKGVWEQLTTRQSNNDPPLGTNLHKSDDFDNISHLGENGKKFKTTSSQKKNWNQRRIFRNLQSSSSINRERVQNSLRKRENPNINTIPPRQNWK